MTRNHIVLSFREFCLANGSEEIKIKYSRYFKEGYDSYGLSSEMLKDKTGEIFSIVKGEFSVNDYMDLGDLLFQSGKYEEGSLAILLAKKKIKEFTPETIDRIGGWLENGVTNWAHTDSISGDLISPCLEKSVIGFEYLSQWRKSEGRWKRRAVPVSLIILAKRKPETIPQLLNFTDCVMEDGERVVHQGLGWFLREAWKKDPANVEEFLLKWKDTSARLIFQYATEKMTKEDKIRFRKEKK
ncbi:MAG: DNA alkylation repair protein [Firmicutes bacterium]|nr:DNA alkylation repair protein [Bacillota bacterium]